LVGVTLGTAVGKLVGTEVGCTDGT
jgi:hypothetical protein